MYLFTFTIGVVLYVSAEKTIVCVVITCSNYSVAGWNWHAVIFKKHTEYCITELPAVFKNNFGIFPCNTR